MMIAFISLSLATTLAYSHGGGLDKDGCHNNRKTGDYHCHNGTSTPPAASLNAFSASDLTAPNQNLTSSFQSCSEVRAAGLSSIRRGEPGYAPHLDRDNDGVACEPYHGR